MTDFICGIDTGGTFTDCVVIDAGGRIVTARRPPPRAISPRACSDSARPRGGEGWG